MNYRISSFTLTAYANKCETTHSRKVFKKQSGPIKRQWVLIMAIGARHKFYFIVARLGRQKHGLLCTTSHFLPLNGPTCDCTGICRLQKGQLGSKVFVLLKLQNNNHTVGSYSFAALLMFLLCVQIFWSELLDG